MQPYQQQFIALSLQYEALRFGEFTLKSGRKSPYFFNAGLFNNGHALKILGECYAKAIIDSEISFDMLFGPAYKGIPLVCATVIALQTQHGLNVPFCFNRKETKEHGEGGLLIGAPLKGRVLILDDVITAGTAMRETFTLIAQHQAEPAGVIVALNREEKGQGPLSAIQELIGEFSVPVQSIISLSHIMEYVTNDKALDSFRQPLIDYRLQYGI